MHCPQLHTASTFSACIFASQFNASILQSAAALHCTQSTQSLSAAYTDSSTCELWQERSAFVYRLLQESYSPRSGALQRRPDAGSVSKDLDKLLSSLQGFNIKVLFHVFDLNNAMKRYCRRARNPNRRLVRLPTRGRSRRHCQCRRVRTRRVSLSVERR